jgi:hypothetical protein
MTNITDVATQVISVAETGKEIYQAVVSAMDSIESVSTAMKGSDKKAIVLAIIQDVVEKAGQSWSTWSTLITNFIDHIKGLYNAIVGVYNSFKSTTATTSV